MKRKEYWLGVRDSLPVGIGYFAVSFGFGVAAVKTVSVVQATVMSLTNLTSAGQFAAVGVIAAASSLWVMLLTQLVINSRYALMSLALGQKFGPSVGVGKRLPAAFFNTDEVFALGMARRGKLTASFFIGAGTVAAIGWIGGTALGALAGSVLPVSVRAALGVMLYGMFIAIVVPQAKEEKPLLLSVLLALLFSSMFQWIPGLKDVSAGLAIVICTVAAAMICAWVRPVDEGVAE